MNYKHGKRHSREYAIWCGILSRCLNPNAKAYPDYGGRGITVCEPWRDFRNFFADMGACPPGFSIERDDNNKGYQPDNCRWASRSEQNNNKRDNIRVTIDGITRSLADWAEVRGLKYGTVHQRLRYGWTPERAVLTPLVPQRDRKAKASMWRSV